MKIICRYVSIFVLIFLTDNGYCQTLDLDTMLIHSYSLRMNELKEKKFYDKALSLNDSILSQTLAYYNDVKRKLWLDRADIFTSQNKWNDAFKSYKTVDSLVIVQNRIDSIFAAGLYYKQGLNYYNLSKYNESIDKYKKSIEIGAHLYGNNDKTVASCYHNIGSCLNSLGKYADALSYYEKSLSIRTIIFGISSEQVAHCYHNMSICNFRLGKYEIATELINEAIQVRTKIYGTTHADIASAYNLLGAIMYQLDKKDLGYYYINEAYKIRKTIFGIDSPNNISSLISLGNLSLTSFEVKSALPLFLKALELQKSKNGVALENLAKIYVGIGSSHFYLGNFENALQNYNKADSIALEIGILESIQGVTLDNRSMSYINLGQYSNAKKYAYKSISKIKEKPNKESTSNLIVSYTSLIKIYFEENNIDSITIIQSLIEKLLASDSITFTVHQNKFFRDLANIYISMDSLDLALYFVNKAKGDLSDTLNIGKYENGDFLYNGALEQYIYNLLYKKTSNIKYYEKSLNLAKTNLYYFEKFKRNLSGESLIRMVGQLYHIYSNYIDIITENVTSVNSDSLNSLIFEICEKSKSNNLYKEYLKNNRSLDKEIKKNLEITNHQLLLLEKSQLKDSLFNIKKYNLIEKLDSLSNLLEEEISISNNILTSSSLTELKKNLAQNQSVISYFVVSSKKQSKIILMHITSELTELHILKDTFKIEPLIKSLNNNITEYFTSVQKSDTLYSNSIKRYCENATTLYQYLLKPVENNLKEEITIIPDFILSSLPFGVLIKETPIDKAKFNTYKFVENEFSISYFSTAYLFSIKNTPNQKKSTLIAFAPFASQSSFKGTEKLRSFEYFEDNITNVDNGVFRSLPNSKLEVSNIASLTKGNYYLNEEANISNLINALKNDAIIHLATHSSSNFKSKELSFIALSWDSTFGGILNLNDINKLKTKSDLIVLSSCESAFGQNKQGEGMLSLTYGFLTAGAKSVLSSLWPVNDFASQLFMTNFYDNLSKGDNKSLAAKKAKLKLLKNKNKTYNHPFFWGAFNVYGNTDSVRF